MFLMLLVLAAGWLALSTAWLAGIVAAALFGWLLVMSLSLPPEAWANYAVGLVAAAAVAFIVHVTRVRTLLRLEGLRLEDARLKRELQTALQRAEAARQAEEDSNRRLAEANQALSRSEARTRALLDAVPDLILRLDRAGKVLDAKRAAQDTRSAPEPHVEARELEAFFSPSAAAALRQGLEAVFTTQRRLTLEIEDEVGETRRCAEARLVKSGEAEVIAIVRDITERKRAEAQRLLMERRLQESQKLESLSALTGGIAHDFNNLLTTILGNASLLKLKLPADSPWQAHLSAVEAASLQAASLCKQMLAYAGRTEFRLAVLDVNALVRGMAELLRSSIGRGIDLRFQLAAEVPPVEADAAQLRQAVLNLVVNGAEAIGDGPGQVTVSTGTQFADRAYLDACEVCAMEAAGPCVFVEVADTGPGLDAATRAKMFDPFFTTKFIGRGLGLAAVLGIARSHRGAIRVRSEPGCGAVFRVLLPALPAAEPAAAAARRSAEWRGRGTALVVDDEEEVCKVAGRLLELLGFGVLAARNGREAVETYQALRDRISVVLLDLAMPEMGGVEAFRELRRLDPNARVLFTSGYDALATLQTLPEGAEAHFLQKPFQLDDLRDKLRGLLEPVAAEAGSAAVRPAN
jgi:PAS domain S-box-containing protein